MQSYRLAPVSLIFLFCQTLGLSEEVAARGAWDEQQRADSVFLRIERIFSGASLQEGSRPEKCGFPLQFEIRRFWPIFTPSKRAFILDVFARPKLQTSVVSPSGRFRIHFDTVGVNTPALLDVNGVRRVATARAYVDSVAATFDHVWQWETQVLGYPSPPRDRGAGGGDEYDIYILEFGGSFYGQTVFDKEDILNPARPNPTYISFIEIDNDYSGYFSTGLAGLKVTAAHEFHHAIQIGNYGFWQDDVYYYEVTSTWMEDVVYDNVNDYYQYLSSYFNNTTLPFTISNGFIEYGRSLWGKFIEKRFSADIIRRSWEHMSSLRSLPAIDAALRERGSSFVRELPEFALWHFFTGNRADTVNYFKEGRAYPLVRVINYVSFLSPSAFISSSARNLSIQFYGLLYDQGSGGRDTVILVLTNINMGAAQQSSDRSYDFSYRFTSDPVDGSYEFLRNGLRLKLIVTDPGNWKSITFLNSLLTTDTETSPYPNPFVAGRSGGITFPLEANLRTRARLYIYSSSFDLVFSKEEESTSQFGRQIIRWDGRDGSGNFVSSGIYVYYLSADKEYKGKIAVVKK